MLGTVSCGGPDEKSGKSKPGSQSGDDDTAGDLAADEDTMHNLPLPDHNPFFGPGSATTSAGEGKEGGLKSLHGFRASGVTHMRGKKYHLFIGSMDSFDRGVQTGDKYELTTDW
jgi:hypothetical protein